VSKRRLVILHDLLGSKKRERRQPGRKPGTPGRGEHVIGSGEIISRAHWGVITDKNSSRMPNIPEHVVRVLDHNFEVLSGERIGQPLMPGRYSYPADLAKQAEVWSSQAATGSLDLGQGARFAQGAADAMRAVGIKPLEAKP